MADNSLKYRRPDIEGGFILNKQDIEYYRVIQRNDVIDNAMLGDYNMVGAYVISGSIVDELIKIKKKYVSSFKKSLFCESFKLIDGQTLNFRVNILNNVPKQGKVTATLELLEEIARTNGYYTNTNSVLISSKEFADGKNVNKEIFNAFNIIDSADSGTVKVETDYDVRSILKRKDFLKQLQKAGYAINSKIEKELFLKRIALLNKYNCVNLLEEFNRQTFHIKDKFLNPTDKLYHRYLNQVLDGILENYGFEIADNEKLVSLLKHEQERYSQIQTKTDTLLTSELNHASELREAKVKTAPVVSVVKEENKPQEFKQPENKEKEIKTAESRAEEKPKEEQPKPKEEKYQAENNQETHNEKHSKEHNLSQKHTEEKDEIIKNSIDVKDVSNLFEKDTTKEIKEKDGDTLKQDIEAFEEFVNSK